MKKGKILSAFIAAAALAGCSADDIQLAENAPVQLAKDGSQLLVTVDEGHGQTTRSGYAQYVKENGKINSVFMWTKGDRFKVYARDTWMPQEFSFKENAKMEGVNDAALFEYSGEERYKDLSAEREYAIFPADSLGMKVAFDNDYRKKLNVTIHHEMEYKSNSDGTYSSYATDIDDNGRVVFNSLVPMFGYAEGNNLKFNYMTAVLRVDLTGVAGDGAEVHTLKLSSTVNQLSGTFDAGFDATNYDTTEYPVLATTELTAENGENDGSISVSFVPVASQSDYTIYIPVPTGVYDGAELTLTYNDETLPVLFTRETNEDGTYKEVKDVEELVLGRGIYLLAEKKTAIEVEADIPGKSISRSGKRYVGLQDVIEQYANSVRPVTINVNSDEQDNIFVDDADVENFHTLNVPALNSNITLNIFNKLGNTTNKVLTIKGAAGKGKLTVSLKKREFDIRFMPRICFCCQ